MAGITPSVTTAPVQPVVRQLPPVKTVVPEAQVDASYTAAKLEIRTKNPYMDADWESVRKELGYLDPYSFMRERSAKFQQEGLEAAAQIARNGDRIMRIDKEKGNVFGRIAFQQYTQRLHTEVVLAALPRFGVKIDVRIYPPEIKVETKGVTDKS